jgi:hypothetical protein
MLGRIGLYLLAVSLVTTSFSANLSPMTISAIKKTRSVTHAQRASTVPLSYAQIPKATLYELLFREITHFNAEADALEAQSKPSAFLRNYHRNLLQLDELFDSQLRQVALSYQRDVEQLDLRAGAIIGKVKGQYRDRRKQILVPPPPKELYDLQNQRIQIINASVDKLATSFGPARYAYLESLVRRHVGSCFRLDTIKH